MKRNIDIRLSLSAANAAPFILMIGGAVLAVCTIATLGISMLIGFGGVVLAAFAAWMMVAGYGDAAKSGALAVRVERVEPEPDPEPVPATDAAPASTSEKAGD